ncbi:MAG TPA: RING finger protein [Acidobacteriota bacterium]|nr:RING finger protein [Acidobacteriota bacterium]
MICPKCNSEYREGFTICADCNVKLVPPDEDSFIEDTENEDEPGEAIASSHSLEIIYETKSSTALDQIVKVVEAREIPYLVQSGTAIHYDVRNKLDWQAVLHVPSKYAPEVRTLIAKLESRKKEMKYTECPFCKTSLGESEHMVECSKCGAGHHLGCWYEQGGCSVFGCNTASD